MEKPENDLQFVINTLRKHRKTHVDWRNWLRRHPDYPTQDIGDADFHNETVQTYDRVIAVLEAL